MDSGRRIDDLVVKTILIHDKWNWDFVTHWNYFGIKLRQRDNGLRFLEIFPSGNKSEKNLNNVYYEREIKIQIRNIIFYHNLYI